MDKTTGILGGVLGVLILLLVSTIWTSLNTTEISTMFVTSVDYDAFRQSTWVYSTDKRYKVFHGLHYDIVPLNTYKFTYKRGMPYSKLIEWEILQTSDVKQEET